MGWKWGRARLGVQRNTEANKHQGIQRVWDTTNNDREREKEREIKTFILEHFMKQLQEMTEFPFFMYAF